MIRGTTPEHKFTIPFDTSLVDKVKVIYAQDDTVVFEKETADCILEGMTITTNLTQEDTLKLDHKKAVQIQLRIVTISGQALASIIEKVGVAQLLDNEVL